MSYLLDPQFTDPRFVKKERARARELRQSPWWKQKLAKGACHYCGGTFRPDELTMDHIIPVARGGRSEKNNIVPSCRDCNQKKKLHTPVDLILEKIKNENGSQN